MRLTLVLAAFVLAMPAAARGKRAVTPERLAEEIATRGAKPCLARLYEDEAAWADVTARIADGEREWLAIATRLLSVAQDPAAYDLEAAVGEALEHAPDHVLELADERGEIAVSWVCGETATFEEDPTEEDLIEMLVDREKAVRAVKEPALAKTRDACLKELAKARAGLERELREATRKIG
jgi:hypothetical protein